MERARGSRRRRRAHLPGGPSLLLLLRAAWDEARRRGHGERAHEAAAAASRAGRTWRGQAGEARRGSPRWRRGRCSARPQASSGLRPLASSSSAEPVWAGSRGAAPWGARALHPPLAAMARGPAGWGGRRTARRGWGGRRTARRGQARGRAADLGGGQGGSTGGEAGGGGGVEAVAAPGLAAGQRQRREQARSPWRPASGPTSLASHDLPRLPVRTAASGRIRAASPASSPPSLSGLPRTLRSAPARRAGAAAAAPAPSARAGRSGAASRGGPRRPRPRLPPLERAPARWAPPGAWIRRRAAERCGCGRGRRTGGQRPVAGPTPRRRVADGRYRASFGTRESRPQRCSSAYRVPLQHFFAVKGTLKRVESGMESPLRRA